MRIIEQKRLQLSYNDLRGYLSGEEKNSNEKFLAVCKILVSSNDLFGI